MYKLFPIKGFNKLRIVISVNKVEVQIFYNKLRELTGFFGPLINFSVSLFQLILSFLSFP